MSAFSILFDIFKKRSGTGSQLTKVLADEISCPICLSTSRFHDAVDFNKSCEEARGQFLESSGLQVKYFLCDTCGFCFAPEIAAWEKSKFEEKIYNDDYLAVDPEYVETRPLANADLICRCFSSNAIRHLDYGGGSGLLSQTLRNRGWDSHSYDPFVDEDLKIDTLGKFELLTAFEVFEHVPDVNNLVIELVSLMATESMILFSTLVSDGEILPKKPLSWWYAAPRNGHISLFSTGSLRVALMRHGLTLVSFSPGLHAAFRNVPSWAQHLIQTQPH